MQRRIIFSSAVLLFIIAVTSEILEGVKPNRSVRNDSFFRQEYSMISQWPPLELPTAPKVNLVSVAAPVKNLTNVPYPREGYNFTVRFSNEFECIGEDGGVLYDCRVDPPFIGYAMPLRDNDAGTSFCCFFPSSPEHLYLSISKSKAMNLDGPVVITASVREAFNVTGSASANFTGGFSILIVRGFVLSTKKGLQLYLTPLFNHQIITVLGNTDLEVHWEDMDMVVERLHLQNSGIGGRAEYRVTVNKNVTTIDKIIFRLQATGQQVEVPVRFDPSSIWALWALFLYYWPLAFFVYMIH